MSVSAYTKLRAKADSFVRELTDGRLYTAYPLRSETVDFSPYDLPVVIEELEAAGYEKSPLGLEAAKYRSPKKEKLHSFGRRRVDPDNPRRQYHVHGFLVDGDVEIHSHYEYRPDLWPVAEESYEEARERIREHLSPTWGEEWGDDVTYVLGRHDTAVSQLVF